MNKPNECNLIAITPNDFWINIQSQPARNDRSMIHVNDFEWYIKLDRELEYKRFDESVEVLEDRLAEFAKRHNLPLFWKRRYSDDLIKAEVE